MKKAAAITVTAALVGLWLGTTPSPAAEEKDGGAVKIIQHSGDKITQRAAQRPSIAGLPESELLSWQAKSQGKGVWTIGIGPIGTGDEQSTSYELTLVDKPGKLPQFKSFVQSVVGSHGSIAKEEQYAYELTLVDGTLAIQDWKPSPEGVVSGTIRGTLKLSSARGRGISPEPRTIEIKFWARPKAK